MQKITFEKWLKKSLLSGELVPNQKLPSEAEVLKRFKISPATVKKVLTKFINLGIVISFQGKGNYVSPLWNNKEEHLKFIPIRDKIIENVEVLPTTLKQSVMPLEIKKHLGHSFNEQEWKPFVKYYFNNKKQIVAYSINWINTRTKFTPEYFLKHTKTTFKDVFKFTLVQFQNTTIKANDEDKKIFKDTKIDYLSNSFSFLYTNDIVPIIVRIIKVKIEYFSTDSRILRQKFTF